MTITVGVVAGLVVSWSTWWWIIRRDKRHGKHRIITVAPTVAAHHPLPHPSWLADLGSQPMSRDDVSATKAKIVAGGGELYDLDEVAKEFGVDLGPDTETWPAPRRTHRDPTTGRYTRKEQ